MLRIKQIHIRNFRSIVNVTLNVEKMNIFVGLNDVGKSNVLKALNLFFNNETEPGKQFNFENDYSKFAVSGQKQAKEIIITVTFSIPEHYKYHEDVVWTKKWRKNGLNYDGSKKWDFSPYSKVPTLLNRIHYKYVPAVKSDDYFKLLLADLYVSIAGEINGELSVKAQEYSDSLKAFTQRIGEIVKKNVNINSNLMMPTNQTDIFKELIFMTNDSSGESIGLSYRGDGIKAMHIPEILKYIAEQDNKILAHSAVPYTPIWGYEEPENGVEMKKCFDLAEDLYDFSNQIQEFITTHSPGFYKLEKKCGAKIFYVYKEQGSFSSVFSENIGTLYIDDKIGIMPIVAPVIQKKQAEIDELKHSIEHFPFKDVDTIFVEGITDKEYLEIAFKNMSMKLQNKYSNGEINIVTREENGCGTSLLVDWAIAWMHLNYHSRAVFLFDNDQAGNNAIKKVKEAKKQYEKKKFRLDAIPLQPTDDMKKVMAIINNTVFFEIEHLLSDDFWKRIENNDWCLTKSMSELQQVYSKVLSYDRTIKDIIGSIALKLQIQDSVLRLNPKEDKKAQILNAVRTEVESGNRMVLCGFTNTLCKLENILCQ